MRGFLTALRFLTVFRVGGESAAGPGEIGRSMVYFPLVGAVQGVVLAVCDGLFTALFPAGVSSALVVAVLALTNGGLHLDGFVDTVDGLAGGSTPEERLRIMREAGAGAVGAAAVAIFVAALVSALSALPEGERTASLLLMPVVARWAMVPMAFWGGYARSTPGLGAAFTGRDGATAAAATAMTALLLLPFFGPASLWMLLVVLGLVRSLTAFFTARLGGVTGDCFGFTTEVAALAFLLCLLAYFG
ncbi:MAG TPA: adenosylcobinamide-GDP ribazoletransferase [Deltaproteobacteria bacterium]|nr:adenosylcobinamide-GDP ribazoletransferase [Deltaproteobacteria bacterium]